VGYAGGQSRNPTYHDLDGHSETIQMDFDPGRITYEQLVDIFWHSHSPEYRPWSWQYASIIFYHNEEQHRLAEETKFHMEESVKKLKIYTQIMHYSEFYPAEDYHQKYWLQQTPELIQEFHRIYPDFKDIVNSTAAARVNGLLGGYGTFDGTAAELSSYGLSTEANKLVMSIARQSRHRGETERVVA
jgi:peptide-methionine (S)-S-oxide reductase